MGTHPIFESDFDCLTDMTFMDRVRIFYLKRLRFLRDRRFIRTCKIWGGLSIGTYSVFWWYQEIFLAVEEKKRRQTGHDSLFAAAINAQVSGFDENVLAENKALKDIIEHVEAKAKTPYENIRVPRPWELESTESKQDFMKRAQLGAQDEIRRRENDSEKEELRIQEQIRIVKTRLAQQKLE